MRGSIIALTALSTATAAAVLVPSAGPATGGTPDTTAAVLSPTGLPYPCLIFHDSRALALRTQCATAMRLRHRARALERDPLR